MLFDSTVVREPQATIDLITNVLESSTEYSIIGKDLDGKILLWNEGARRIYGYEPEEVVGRANSEILHTPEDVAAGKPREILAFALKNGKWEGTLYRVRKNGERFVARLVITPRRDASGDAVGFLLISKDISDEIHLIDELKTAQFYTRSLIESNIDALMTTDPLGVITDVNRQMCEMSGYGRGELIGSPFKRYFTDPRRAEDGIEKVLAEGRVANYELTMRSKSGRETVVSHNATTFRDTDGRLRGVFAAARDITEQKRLEEQLRRKNEELEEQYRRVQEANRLKSEFLANMSHELRTPLNGIIGFAELMHDGKVGAISPLHREYLGYILTSSTHLLQLINDVLDLAKVESGKLELRPVPVDLTRLVGEVVDSLHTLADKKGIQVVTGIAPELGEVVIDPAKLKQILYNYLSNALKFTPEGGRVTIRLEPADRDFFRLAVEDTGIGVATEDLGRLFVEFEQLGAGAAKKYPGTGLGLALTKRLVEAQGGEVGVRSTLGQGSVFFASLPRVVSAEPALSARDHSTTGWLTRSRRPARPPQGPSEGVPRER